MPSLKGVGSPERRTGSVAEPESELALLTKRYEQFQQFEAEKNKFQHELLTRIQYLIQERETLEAERQQETEFVNNYKLERFQFQTWYKSVTRLMAENSFIMVLIDGDGMIFNEAFIQQGESGGFLAASKLYAVVEEWARDNVEGLAANVRIVCRVYANVKGLGNTLVSKGMIQDLTVFEDFVRGFTGGKSLFDFVDVGSGKDRADKKIVESFHMSTQDMHCHRVLFGCSHDNGYARTLEECADRPEIRNKVVLLEGTPFEKELRALPYPYSTHKFPGLFRDVKLDLYGRATTYYSAPADADSAAAKSYNMFTGMPSRLPAPARTGVLDSPLPSKAALAQNGGLPRTPSSSTIASDAAQAVAKPPAAGTWAALAAAQPLPAAEPKPYNKPPVQREEAIARNRAGQRIDPVCKNFDPAELKRVKQLKMCNVHYLRKTCPYGNKCSHSHSYNPNEDELKTLRLVARMSPCINGTGCQDVKCIYGHRCPAPMQHRTGSLRGTKSCAHGDTCKFPPELHDIDMNVVKTLVIR